MLDQGYMKYSPFKYSIIEYFKNADSNLAVFFKGIDILNTYTWIRHFISINNMTRDYL